MSGTVKAIMVLAVVLGSIAAVLAGFIVIALHGGFTTDNMGALGLLITTVTTLGATIINLVRTEQLSAKVTNGLIPEKVAEAVKLPEVKAEVADAVSAVLQSNGNDKSPGPSATGPAQ
jgi:hypothetical protein